MKNPKDEKSFDELILPLAELLDIYKSKINSEKLLDLSKYNCKISFDFGNQIIETELTKQIKEALIIQNVESINEIQKQIFLKIKDIIDYLFENSNFY